MRTKNWKRGTEVKKRVEGLVRQFREARKRRLRFEALMTALSVLVTGGVFWQLRRQGTAISDETAPAAELPEAAIPVVETDADPPDETARSGIAEEPEDWEAELPVFTNESAQQRIAAIAVSQLGYSEGSEEVLLSDDGMSRSGYTRYGAWYGNPYGEWNSLFTYFCMYYAGIEKTEIPYGSGCWSWYETLSEKEMIAPCGTEEPGDILFFDTDADGEADRTGIVTGTAETEEGVQISVIEGNAEGTVAEKQYLRGGSEMIGVLSVDDYVTDLPEGVKLIDYSGDTESGIHVAAQAVEGVFPEGTVMQAKDVPDEDAMQHVAELYAETEMVCKAAVDISFFTPDGEELQPTDGNKVQVRITLPADKMPADEFHLLHVPENGTAEQVETALLTPEGVAFSAESFSMYIITDLGSNDGPGEASERSFFDVINKYSYPDNNYNDCGSAAHPYIVYPGDIIEVGATGSNFWVANNTGTYGNILARTADGNDRPYTMKNGTAGVHAEYVANTTGTCQIRNGGDTLYVEVLEPIMVKSEFGYKQKDRIREYLGWNQKYQFGFGLTNRDGYVPNGPSRPYLMHVGEILDIYSYSDTTDTTTKFWDETYTSVPRNDDNPIPGNVVAWNDPNIDAYRAIQPITQWDASRESWDVVEYDAEAGKTKHSIQFQAIKPGFNCIHFGGQVFWVRVYDDDTMYTHADMEIADGGVYAITSVRYQGGKKYTDVKVYNASVCYVNYAELYDASNNRLTRFSSDDGDYENIGESGSTQYELSSAYICTLDNDGTKASKYYKSKNVDHAVFNMNVQLVPNISYSLDENGEIVSGSMRPLNEPLKVVEDVLAYLGPEAVNDARNKCPLNNGLDFTIRAQSAFLQIEAEKILTGRQLKDEEFSFEIIDPNNGDQVLATAKNDADGKIVFDNLRFEEEGTATYILREVIPAVKEKNMYYTQETFPLNIVVKKSLIMQNGEEMEVLYAELEDDSETETPQFQNDLGYELPHTGGTGTLPFMAGGIILISAAFVLPLIRRRKEDETDS